MAVIFPLVAPGGLRACKDCNNASNCSMLAMSTVLIQYLYSNCRKKGPKMRYA
jgi:hypothetical protein